MSKIRRGGFIFITWKGDHPPKHVHIYSNGRFVAKWDIERERVMEGRVSTNLLRILLSLKLNGEI